MEGSSFNQRLCNAKTNVRLFEQLLVLVETKLKLCSLDNNRDFHRVVWLQCEKRKLLGDIADLQDRIASLEAQYWSL